VICCSTTENFLDFSGISEVLAEIPFKNAILEAYFF
jgi:hypothetical protein